MNCVALFCIFSLLASLNNAIEIDFCVGDSILPRGPEGYACKDPANVTVDDFVYSGFRGERTIINNVFKFNGTLASSDTFPALNGLGISIGVLDLGVGGVIPVHSHRTSEVIVVVEGTITAGFIDTNNDAYYKTLEVGDVMIFPQTLLHFQINNGEVPARAFVSLNGANPGIQITSNSLFAGNLPGDIAEKITLISAQEVNRMKEIFASA